MAVHKGVTGALVALILMAGAASAQASPQTEPPARPIVPPTSAKPTLPLSHAGRWITDADGRVVMMHGANMVTKTEPNYPSGVGFGDDDAEFLSSHGFTVVRVGLMWKKLEPEPGVYDASYVKQIKRTVRMLAKHGILSLLDSHQDMYSEVFHGQGFPEWASQDGGLDNTDYGFPNNYALNPALQHAENAFYSNAPGPDGVGLADHYAQAWAYVAKAFKKSKSVVGYELVNEPAGQDFASCLTARGCPKFDKQLAAFYKKVTAAIRKVDPKTLIWEEPDVGFNFGNTKVRLPALKDKRSGFAFHPYCADVPSTGTSASCDAANDHVLKYALAQVKKSKQAVFATEFGAIGNPDEIIDEVQRLDRNMVPWTHWAYWDGGTTTTPYDDTCDTCSTMIRSTELPPTGTNVVSGMERALTEPYPYVVAGTPTKYGYDFDTHVFTAAYSTTRAGTKVRFVPGSRTVIETPAYDYPDGYIVKVKGAKVVSQPNAAHLVLASKKGAKKVTVTVTPSRS